jgi:hypothetical protein
MSNAKYTKRRVRNGTREVYNTQTSSWETFMNTNWNLSVWTSIDVDETVKFSNSTSSSCDSGYYSSSSDSSSSSSYDSGSSDSGSCGGD